jgi:hypothetical protein
MKTMFDRDFGNQTVNFNSQLGTWIYCWQQHYNIYLLAIYLCHVQWGQFGTIEVGRN